MTKTQQRKILGAKLVAADDEHSLLAWTVEKMSHQLFNGLEAEKAAKAMTYLGMRCNDSHRTLVEARKAFEAVK